MKIIKTLSKVIFGVFCLVILSGCQKKALYKTSNISNMTKDISTKDIFDDFALLNKSTKNFVLENQINIKTTMSDGLFFDKIIPKTILLDYRNLSGHDIDLEFGIKNKLIAKGYKVLKRQEITNYDDIGAILELNLIHLTSLKKERSVSTKKDLISNCVSVAGLVGGFTFITMQNFLVGAIAGSVGTYLLSELIYNEPNEYTMKMEVKISPKSYIQVNAHNSIVLNKGQEGKEYLKWDDQRFRKSYTFQIEKSLKKRGKSDNIIETLKYNAINTIANIISH